MRAIENPTRSMFALVAALIAGAAHGQQNVCIAGAVTNTSTPAEPGFGVQGFWSYGGQIGVAAGNGMCAAIGAARVCSLGDLAAAEELGELGSLAAGTYWVHRVRHHVRVNDAPSAPGPGGRCNDWTTNTNHITNGEFLELGAGGLTWHFDPDTVYDGTPAHVQPVIDCDDYRAVPCCLATCPTLVIEDGFEATPP